MLQPIRMKFYRGSPLLTERQYALRLAMAWLYSAAWLAFVVWLLAISRLAFGWKTVLMVPVLVGMPSPSDLLISYCSYKSRWEAGNHPEENADTRPLDNPKPSRPKGIFSSSVIKRSGQWSKFVGGLSSFTLGGLAMYAAVLGRKELGAEQSGIMVLIAVLVAVGSMCFTLVCVRCPSCGERWLWKALKARSDYPRVGDLLSQPTCPNCGHPDENRTQRG